MRITTLQISGFRAFSGSEEFDLDADAVLITGANGQGKTSLLDAIHWALTGEIGRLGQPQSVVSLYSASGEARVAVGIRSGAGEEFTVTRHFDGVASSLLVTDSDRMLRGPEAENELLSRLWPQALSASDPRAALRSAMERGVYLQQDLLTSFLSAETDQERFTAISELIGTGRVTELQSSLERSRAAWSRVTNTRESEARDTADRLSRLETQLRTLTEIGPQTSSPIDEEWDAWWSEVEALGLARAGRPPQGSSTAPGALDAAVNQLQALTSSQDRRGQLLRAVAADLRELNSSQPIDVQSARQASDAAASELTTARELLRDAEDAAAALRRMQVELRAEQDELRVLADVALRHLGDHCPVCQQAYDIDATRTRLTLLARGADDSANRLPSLPDLAAIAARVESLEIAASTAATAFAEAERAARDRAAREDQIRIRLTELGLIERDIANVALEVDREIARSAESLLGIQAARQRGEALALLLARTGQEARRAEVEAEVARTREGLEAARADVQARHRTGEVVTSIVEALREATSDLVEDELGRLEPLLQRIYATADPHPEFRVMKLLSRMRQGRGRVFASIEDPLHGLSSEIPGSYLSSSQMNVLAVSVFLALNLGMSTLPLQVAVLDDPLQSLDDLNLLGMTDLFRRIREHRQLILSTHDTRFAALLERKLRPVSGSQRTVVIEMQGWSGDGPSVVQRDVARDPTPLRIVAA